MVHSANNTSLLDLSQLPEAARYFIAYSGGMDSTALLHAVHLTDAIDNNKITAIHINHNIHSEAINWANHCDDFCKKLGIKLISVSVKLNGTSEDVCRQARLAVYQQKLSANDCLITGHHLNDQVETVLFRLLRGTGLQGLTGMSKLSRQADYLVFRPMLAVTKHTINTYVEQNQLNYVDDPSNQDNQYSRNFIRNQLLPLITEKYPDALNSIELSRNNFIESQNLLNTFINKVNPLAVAQFADVKTLTSTLYHWLSQFNIKTTNHRALNQFANDCINCASDKLPILKMPDWQIRYWQDKVYLLRIFKSIDIDKFNLNLTAQQKIKLPNDLGTILISSDKKFTIQATIKYAQSHDKIKLTGHQHRHKVKNLFQSKQIPPWERVITPYLYVDDELMAVGTYFMAENFIKLLSAYNAEYQWLSPQLLL